MFFFFKQKTAYEIMPSLVGSEMCIRDSPQAIFELAYFRERPEAFYALARELWPGTYCPTTTHLFIKLLHDKGRLLRCFTQNIDSLESAAGVPAELTVAAHGNFDSATCIDTGASVDPAELKAAIDAGPPGWRALRDREGGLVKPDIVFFGEGLPRRFFELATQDPDNLLTQFSRGGRSHIIAGVSGWRPKPPPEARIKPPLMELIEA